MNNINECAEFCRGCEICDKIEKFKQSICGNCNTCTENDYCKNCQSFKCECSCDHEKIRIDFLDSNQLCLEKWKDVCPHIPYTKDGEFYFKLEHMGNKHFVSSEHTEDVITWMKLTEKLFL